MQLGQLALHWIDQLRDVWSTFLAKEVAPKLKPGQHFATMKDLEIIPESRLLDVKDFLPQDLVFVKWISCDKTSLYDKNFSYNDKAAFWVKDFSKTNASCDKGLHLLPVDTAIDYAIQYNLLPNHRNNLAVLFVTLPLSGEGNHLNQFVLSNFSIYSKIRVQGVEYVTDRTCAFFHSLPLVECQEGKDDVPVVRFVPSTSVRERNFNISSAASLHKETYLVSWFLNNVMYPNARGTDQEQVHRVVKMKSNLYTEYEKSLPAVPYVYPAPVAKKKDPVDEEKTKLDAQRKELRALLQNQIFLADVETFTKMEETLMKYNRRYGITVPTALRWKREMKDLYASKHPKQKEKQEMEDRDESKDPKQEEKDPEGKEQSEASWRQENMQQFKWITKQMQQKTKDAIQELPLWCRRDIFIREVQSDKTPLSMLKHLSEIRSQ